MSEKNEQPALTGVPDMEGAIAAVAVNVTTWRAALSLLGAVYDAVFVVVSPIDRKRWRTPRELISTGWDDAGAMTEGYARVYELADFLIAMSERFRGRPGNAFASLVVGLAHCSVLLHVLRRRAAELREGQTGTNVRTGGESAGGGDLTDGAEAARGARLQVKASGA